jgi:hypothetical protein
MIELDIEKNVKDKNLYKYDEAEPKEKKQYRQKKAVEDIDKRLKEWHKYVGLDFNNPGEAVQINVLLNTLETIKNILIKKEIMTQESFDDMYWITAEHSLQVLEIDKDNIKDNIKKQKMNMMLRGNIANKMMGPQVMRN